MIVSEVSRIAGGRAILWLAVGWALAGPGPLAAEETIFDPENPNVDSSAGESSDQAGDESGEDEDSAETIADPERPETDNEEASGESEEASATSDEGETDESAGNDAGSSADTAFRGAYGMGLDIDTAWTGEEDIVELTGSGYLQLEQPIGERWEAVVRGEFRHWMAGKRREEGPNLLVNAAEPRAEADMRLGESYAIFRAERWSVRIGNLITSWGSTDIVRPGDFVNPVDLTTAQSSATGGRPLIAQPAIETSYIRPNWSLTGVVVPFFVPNRVALFGRDTAVLTRRNPLVGSQIPVADLVGRLVDSSLNEEVQPLLLAQSQPDELFGNASMGLRATGTRWNTDFGLSYFWGWDRTPWLRVDEDLRRLGRLAVDDGQVLRDFDLQGFIERNPEALSAFDAISEKQQAGEELVDSEYRRMQTLLVDVARYIGPIGLRADVALNPERTYVTDRMRTVRRPTLFSALGLSWEELLEPGPLAVTVEGFWLKPFGADSPVTEAFVAELERGSDDESLLLLEDGYWGIAGAVDWATPLWGLELTVGTVVEVQTGGLVVDGRVSKTFGGWFETSVGGTLYEGPDPAEELSFGGLYDNNDRVGLRVRAEF